MSLRQERFQDGGNEISAPATRETEAEGKPKLLRKMPKEKQSVIKGKLKVLRNWGTPSELLGERKRQPLELQLYSKLEETYILPVRCIGFKDNTPSVISRGTCF